MIWERHRGLLFTTLSDQRVLDIKRKAVLILTTALHGNEFTGPDTNAIKNEIPKDRKQLPIPEVTSAPGSTHSKLGVG